MAIKAIIPKSMDINVIIPMTILKIATKSMHFSF
jgi:hypothetical protein